MYKMKKAQQFKDSSMVMIKKITQIKFEFQIDFLKRMKFFSDNEL